MDNTDCDDDNNMDVDITVSGNPIGDGYYIANRKIITADSVDAAANNITLQAGEEIVLGVGFVAGIGSDFKGMIGSDCNTGSSAMVQGVTSTEMENEIVSISEEVREESKVSKPSVAALKLYPNPTRVSTNIAFTIPEDGVSILEVYNNTGILVKRISNVQRLEAGEYSEELDTSHFPAGIYVVVLRTAQKTLTKKLIVVE